MFVLCVVSKNRKAKCRKIKTQKQGRMKYRVQENTIKLGRARYSFFPPETSRPVVEPTQPISV